MKDVRYQQQCEHGILIVTINLSTGFRVQGRSIHPHVSYSSPFLTLQSPEHKEGDHMYNAGLQRAAGLSI